MTIRPFFLLRLVLLLAAGALAVVVVGLPESNAAFTRSTSTNNTFASLHVPSVVRTAEWWLDAAAPANLFSDTGCTVPATTAGAQVKCWKNHNNTSIALKQYGTTTPPVISSSPFGDHRGVEFTNGTIIGPDLFGGSLSNVQVFIVSRENVRAANYFLNLNGLNDATSVRFTVHLPWNDGKIYWDPGNAGTNRSYSVAPPLGTPMIFNGWKDSVDGRNGHRVNGGTSYYSAGNTPGATTGGLAMGQNGHNDTAEVIVFGHRLTPAQELEVENYLKAKWGIA